MVAFLLVFTFAIIIISHTVIFCALLVRLANALAFAKIQCCVKQGITGNSIDYTGLRGKAIL